MPNVSAERHKIAGYHEHRDPFPFCSPKYDSSIRHAPKYLNHKAHDEDYPSQPNTHSKG